MESQDNSDTERARRVTIVREELPPFPPAVVQMRNERMAKKVSKLIDDYLKEEGKKLDPINHLMILLLGPGDSGKSTVLKQMIMLHRNGFTKAERDEIAPTIQLLILQSVQVVLQYCLTYEPVWESREIEDAVTNIINYKFQPDQTSIPIEAKEWAVAVSESQHYRTASLKGEDIGINATYPHYVPTDDDILQIRRKTENISETVFEIEKKFWHVIDVAGQKDKRARWTTYMEKRLSGVIYVFSCAAYNQMMEEQPDLNRIDDAIQLFTSICTNSVLKVQRPNDKKFYMEWLQKEFVTISKNSNITSYLFKTTATDVQLMQKVLFSIKDNIMRGQAKELGVI
ncbi:G-protein alpha subunit-domain-containing protein [Gorgonomyces haynaldii]|nr:G-protein alpha subunit-domain-containing protein [Gorgonomyces haynaldii]